MSEPSSAARVEAAGLEIRGPAAEAIRVAGTRDGPLSAGPLTRAARRAVAAWAAAVDGDDTALAAMAAPQAVHWLLHPVHEDWQVAPGPMVTAIEIWDFDAAGARAGAARLRVRFEFGGRRLYGDPGRRDDGETLFAGMIDLTLADSGPWRLTSGHVRTLDDVLGYVFTSRRETPEEYRRRVGGSPGPADPPGRSAGTLRRFRLRAGFAEHDERFGSSAEVELQRETAPAREEAVRLVWPAVEAETARALGEGDWRPSLNWLDLIELLDEPPPP